MFVTPFLLIAVFYRGNVKRGWKLREFTEKIVWNENRGENPFLKKILNFMKFTIVDFIKVC